MFIHPSQTALVTIDLQKFILSRPLAPHSAEQLIEQNLRLASAVKQAGGVVIEVVIRFSEELVDLPQTLVDTPIQLPNGRFPEDGAERPDALRTMPADLRITKRAWSAFYGTELDVQLRRRGIENLIITGVATNLGVESTARDAWHHNYAVVIPEDGVSSLNAEWHSFSIGNIMPRISRVRSTEQIAAALTNS